MPDNWGFVLAAYALAALVLGGYWRRLEKREREAKRERGAKTRAPSPRAPVSGHPRSEPASRPPVQ